MPDDLIAKIADAQRRALFAAEVIVNPEEDEED